jgi:hypothetical protein
LSGAWRLGWHEQALDHLHIVIPPLAIILAIVIGAIPVNAAFLTNAHVIDAQLKSFPVGQSSKAKLSDVLGSLSKLVAIVDDSSNIKIHSLLGHLADRNGWKAAPTARQDHFSLRTKQPKEALRRRSRGSRVIPINWRPNVNFFGVGRLFIISNRDGSHSLSGGTPAIFNYNPEHPKARIIARDPKLSSGDEGTLYGSEGFSRRLVRASQSIPLQQGRKEREDRSNGNRTGSHEEPARVTGQSIISGIIVILFGMFLLCCALYEIQFCNRPRKAPLAIGIIAGATIMGHGLLYACTGMWWPFLNIF